MTEDTGRSVVYYTADIVAGYVSANKLDQDRLPELIEAVYQSLVATVHPTRAEPPAPRPEPAAPIRKSITPEYLISLEDGKPYKSLKRRLRAQYGMSPDEYRQKWGLPKDYPMVAPNYSPARPPLGPGGQKKASELTLRG